MRIALVAMSGVRVRNDALRTLGVTLPGFVRRGEVIASLPSLGLLTLAGMTPAHHILQYLEIDALDDAPDIDADLVAISSFTARIDAAYSLAERCRGKGSTVVMGGLHVTACPDEAMERADAIIVGSGEGAWPKLLDDAERGKLQRRYRGPTAGVFDAPLYAPPRYDLLRGLQHNRITVQTTRGCPRDCAFCAASLRLGGAYQRKAVALVIEEIRAAKAAVGNAFFEFADDNTFLDHAWSKELLRALAREEIHFFTETDASLADDPELCDLLAEAGCRQVLVGFESPRADDLQDIDPANWKRVQAPRIRHVVDTLQSRGVSVNGCFILGLDHHSTDVFPDVLDFVRSSGLAEVQFTVLTPFPGTPLYQQLRADKRLLRERFWDRCTLFDVNFVPKHMRVEELEAGMTWLFREAYNANATRERTRAFVEAKSKYQP
jgi:radical SAM superfamily enzyme YgiQ (UPF0313 family)